MCNDEISEVEDKNSNNNYIYCNSIDMYVKRSEIIVNIRSDERWKEGYDVNVNLKVVFE